MPSHFSRLDPLRRRQLVELGADHVEELALGHRLRTSVVDLLSLLRTRLGSKDDVIDICDLLADLRPEFLGGCLAGGAVHGFEGAGEQQSQVVEGVGAALRDLLLLVALRLSLGAGVATLLRSLRLGLAIDLLFPARDVSGRTLRC